MKYPFLYLALIFQIACSSSNEAREWGATTSENNELTTIYWAVQGEIMRRFPVYDRDFESRETRYNRITKVAEGHMIDSWFYRQDEMGDSTKVHFEGVVVYDQAQVRYVVTKLTFR